MKKIATDLRRIGRGMPPRFRQFSEKELTAALPGKWSKKEILGHLIDSAANNHQRFVRAQRGEVPVISYNQNDWVSIQNYNNANTSAMLLLWKTYNMHLAYIILQIPDEKLQEKVIMGGEEKTLQWVVEDYMRHLDHHLVQIFGQKNYF